MYISSIGGEGNGMSCQRSRSISFVNRIPRKENVSLPSLIAIYKGLNFPILKQFATKLCNFINFNIFFPAVVKDFANYCVDEN